MYGQLSPYGAYGAASRACVKSGDTGADVTLLQTKLAALMYGYETISGSEPLEVTGTFDANTDASVREFQQNSGLGVDGVVGPNTWAKLGETGASCGGGGSYSVSSYTSGAGGIGDPVVNGQPFYQKKWFLPAVGVTVAGVVALIIFWPKK